MKELSPKRKIKKALEDIITTEVSLINYLEINYGTEAVIDFYKNYRPQFIFDLKMGAIKKALAKIASKIAKETLIKMLIETLIENGWYQSIDDIEIKEISKKGAIVEMKMCSRKNMFRKINKKINNPFNIEYFCEKCCIPEFEYYLNYIGLQPEFEIMNTGCLITAQWEKDILEKEIEEKVK